MAHLGPLLTSLLDRIDRAGVASRERELVSIASHVGGDEAPRGLPLVVQMKPQPPREGEGWPAYKSRVGEALDRLNDAISGGRAQPLLLSNGLAARPPVDQVTAMAGFEGIDRIELDPRVTPALMDDVVADVKLASFRQRHPGLSGQGVRVAVLDSGVDVAHPYLTVSASVTTCGEDWNIPGDHGTHCAGIIASRDAMFPGVAPDVTLLNVKVMRNDGTGTHTDIALGIDKALDLGADVLSLSLGLNHLPPWSDGGHGWACPDGRCPLCMAVDNAVSLGTLVCVAAGNEHGRAEALRGFGHANTFDTELACPGQARGAITVGAITKRSFLPAHFSSRGPTAFGSLKPDLSAAGVNVMSTVRVPRLADGTPIVNPPRSQLLGRMSGTSMAAPVAAGAVALLIQSRRARGLPVTPTHIRADLLQGAVASMGISHDVVGAGRLDLSTA